ncbi:hypothetical protein HDU91_005633 [Kappamyces sp. JEL0680]|nr:hypothetical protein HDU91_005633 [Kappamyces sp. JEL0680]
MFKAANRLFSQPGRTPPRNIAFAFDIDGVLLQGRRVLPHAKRALRLLERERIPFIVLTNGGGILESEKAQSLSRLLDCEIGNNQVILSHTPMKSLVPEYRHHSILMVGPESCKDVALHYGFEKVVTPSELFHLNPDIWPFDASHGGHHHDLATVDRIAAILMFHDSPHWGRDMQVMLDCLWSTNGHIHLDGDKQAIPVYFSNSDLLWRAHHTRLRLAQGSFRHAFASLYKRLTSEELVYTSFGKPTLETYQYADALLHRNANRNSAVDRFESIYMIGDNPLSDIAGANAFGRGWESVLVRTGVWNEGRDGHVHGAGHVCNDVEEAVCMALDRH